MDTDSANGRPRTSLLVPTFMYHDRCFVISIPEFKKDLKVGSPKDWAYLRGKDYSLILRLSLKTFPTNEK